MIRCSLGGLRRALGLALCLLAGSAGAAPPSEAAAFSHFHRVDADVALAGRPTDDAAGTLAAAGVATVIDLRQPEERDPGEGTVLAAAKIRYLEFPTAGTAPTPERLAAFADLLESSDPPRVLHCNTGNRAGMMWGLYRLHQGMTLDAVLRELGGIVDREPLLEVLRNEAARLGRRTD